MVQEEKKEEAVVSFLKKGEGHVKPRKARKEVEEAEPVDARKANKAAAKLKNRSMLTSLPLPVCCRTKFWLSLGMSSTVDFDIL